MTPERTAPPSPTLELRVIERENAHVGIALQGSISHDTSIGLVTQLLKMAMSYNPATVTLDLGQVGFIDSQGIGVICELHRELEKRAAKLSLRNLSPTAMRIMTLMRLDQLIEIG